MLSANFFALPTQGVQKSEATSENYFLFRSFYKNQYNNLSENLIKNSRSLRISSRISRIVKNLIINISEYLVRPFFALMTAALELHEFHKFV